MKYKKEMEFSYTFGAFPTMELIKNKTSAVKRIILHDKLVITDDVQTLIDLAKKSNILVEYNSKFIDKIVDKDNIFVVGEFNKFSSFLTSGNMVVLVNPSDMGNLGTIFRSCLGFNVKNIALIEPHADYFNPKVIRASMGSVFSLNIKSYETFDDFLKENNDKKLYMFTLDGKQTLQETKFEKNIDNALVFGNEACGLPDEIKKHGTGVFIKHNHLIDSLNLSISVAISLYELSK